MTTSEILVGVGYIRVSQDRVGQIGYGLQAQENDIEKHSKYRDIKLFHVYKENGQSGYDRERPELKRMLEDAKAGKFNVVIFPSIDRAGRSVKDIIEIEALLRKEGIDVVFVREGIDTSTPVGELFRNIMASIAQFEGRLIQERLSKGKHRKAAEGGYIGGWLPYGYSTEEEQVIIIPEEALTVEQIFAWRADGKSLREICSRLNEEGVPTKRNGKWRISTVTQILNNRYYTGRVEFEGAFIRGQHDAIISDLLFQRCQ
jgi:DNA invertase Pin-like site-specific DNA recombinase